MLYSDVLFEAVKSASLIDAGADSLTQMEKSLYSGCLRSAIARFNNNPHISIGTEKVLVRRWHSDGLSPFARLVHGDSNNLEIFAEGEGGETSVSKIKWRGVNGRSMQEIPQRLISATVQGTSPHPLPYRIVNEKNFFEIGRQSPAICYAAEENQGIVRVWQPAPLLLLFDRAILFPWETKPGESISTETGEYDPLSVEIMLPASHIPYLACLAALEIANGAKCDAGLVAQLKDQLASQERELMRSNARDRVKTSFANRDYAANFWAGRGE
jgi:hypothetical protein